MTAPILVIELAGVRCALPCDAVHGVIELEAIIPVPRAAPHVIGLTALRSEVLTVIDAAAAIGLPARRANLAGERVVVIDHQGHRYALVVDRVDDVCQPLSPPSPAPADAGPQWTSVAREMVETAGGLTLMIDLAAFMNSTGHSQP